ncbi:hypothetical protein BDV98DRAFT_654395 [Pterulicium gracile]|uniref:Uncharacterized protein n=1 Tax=Pterulicium gracile TaxID=1884261 RepID=A0A5C3QU63_9AGAR|nr:hypothetical protein BDV98DRAFT_654395 [Pterula gracilis]
MGTPTGAGTISGSSYAYLNQPQQQNSYGGQQQQPQNQLAPHLAQFDPYSSLNSLDQQQQQQPQQTGYPTQPQQIGYQQPQQQQTGYPQSSPLPPTSSTQSHGPNPANPSQPHPLTYVHAHKQELETWDQYTWTQSFQTFDTLRDAWTVRKAEIEGHVRTLEAQQRMGGGYEVGREAERLRGMGKEAGNNADTVAASLFQMREVHEGYRQSSDVASKRRVREASNSALRSLPDWPPLAY